MSNESRKRRSAAEWSSILDDWRTSGETLKSYASLHGLNAGTMSWWRTQLERGRSAGTSGENELSQSKVGGASTPAFARVVVTQPACEGGHIEVIARSGHVVRIVGAVDVERFRTLLGALDAC